MGHPGQHFPQLCALLLEVLACGWAPAIVGRCLAVLPSRYADDAAVCIRRLGRRLRSTGDPRELHFYARQCRYPYWLVQFPELR
eukprot:6888795-Alexandrium_andersonii.AAC.1